MRDRVLDCLRSAQKPLRAREVAARLGGDRREVNLELYGLQRDRQVMKFADHTWGLVDPVNAQEEKVAPPRVQSPRPREQPTRRSSQREKQEGLDWGPELVVAPTRDSRPKAEPKTSSVVIDRAGTLGEVFGHSLGVRVFVAAGRGRR